MWQYNYSISPYLYHHGIKGMKWGVRRTPLGHYKKSMLKNMIRDGIISTRINVSKQNRHILSSKSHTQNLSYIFGTTQDAQRLVDEYSGKGKLIPKLDGELTRKERITCPFPIGVYIDINNNVKTVTNSAMII